MSDEERRALQVYIEQDNQVNPKFVVIIRFYQISLIPISLLMGSFRSFIIRFRSRGIVINCYGRSIVYQEVGFDLGDTPLSEWEESFASKQYVCCHHFPNDVRRSIDGQPKIFDNAILEDGINDSFESDENEDPDLQLKSHKQKKNESTLHEGFNLLSNSTINALGYYRSASSLFIDKGNSSSTIFQESTSVLPTVSMIQNIKEERQPPSKLMNYDMEVEPIKCSLDDVINSVASKNCVKGALGDSDRKKASLEKLSREAQQNHMETEHCRDSCEYGYVRGRASTSLYIQDTYTNRSGKPPGYPCPVMGCTQSYVYQNGLYRHLNSVHVMETYGVTKFFTMQTMISDVTLQSMLVKSKWRKKAEFSEMSVMTDPTSTKDIGTDSLEKKSVSIGTEKEKMSDVTGGVTLQNETLLMMESMMHESIKTWHLFDCLESFHTPNLVQLQPIRTTTVALIHALAVTALEWISMSQLISCSSDGHIVLSQLKGTTLEKVNSVRLSVSDLPRKIRKSSSSSKLLAVVSFNRSGSEMCIASETGGLWTLILPDLRIKSIVSEPQAVERLLYIPPLIVVSSGEEPVKIITTEGMFVDTIPLEATFLAKMKNFIFASDESRLIVYDITQRKIWFTAERFFVNYEKDRPGFRYILDIRISDGDDYTHIPRTVLRKK
uniref:C2H2-type domain-containing protein n=1 Tax=Heterorhabditis bacteriophora TaxID=37862 RepID=A0A1I7X1X6_HETBA